jgi:serine/threonine-protein kinase
VTNSHDNGGSAAAGHVKPGDVLLGKYRVEHVIGEGGMGVVVSAYHLHLDERVAIKFLLPKVVPNQEAVARFAREARAAVKIKSEHVARVSDVGTLSTGAPYMVMEYLEGQDLDALLLQDGPLEVERAVDYVLQACEAIATAHTVSIVHRDLKPSNLFLTHRADGTPCIKVLDFGISKMTDDSPKLTKTTGAMGTPAYMSPEQLRSARDVDARADIWSLGVILHELLTNRLPFDGQSLAELCADILTTPAHPVRSHAPDLPADLEKAILRCMKKDPGDRFQSVAELASALAPFASEGMRAMAHRMTRITPKGGRASLLEAESLAKSTAAHAPTQTASEADMASRSSAHDATVVADERMALPTYSPRWPWWVAGAAGIGLVVWWLVPAADPRPDAHEPPAAIAPAAQEHPPTVVNAAPSASPSSDMTHAGAPAVASALPPPARSVPAPRGKVPAPRATATTTITETDHGGRK